MGCAGGTKKISGFTISHAFDVLGKQATLSGLKLAKDKLDESETVFGNIGQDLIKQFDKITLNFNRMFISFE